MQLIIRTHIKNEERLKLLKQSIESAQSQDFKDIIIVDDQSPLQEKVKDLVKSLDVTDYVLTEGKPDTKNGFYYSLKQMKGIPAILAVDDFICSKYLRKEFNCVVEDIAEIKDIYGCIGFFACYPSEIRARYKNTNLWNINIDALYALLFHIISPQLKDIMVKEWEAVLKGEFPYPEMCDDLWLATVCKREGLLAFSTTMDYVDHTGIKQRSFGDVVEDDNSCYTSPAFVK